MKKICIITGTRAEYGLLKPVIDKVYRADDMELNLVVTGMHLSAEFGWTYQEIEQDGYPIHAKIEMLLSSDTAVGITKSMGVELIGFSDYFAVNAPDMVIILGDRYEAFIAAAAAMMSRIPIAHIHGGEITEGAIDEAIRHSITKMSHIHFTAADEYRKRVIQMGESPETVYNVGSLGVEGITTLKLLTREELEKSIGFVFSRETIMVTYHPATLANMTSAEQFQNILDVLDEHPELDVIFTKANSDTDGRIINSMIDKYVEDHQERCRAYISLGQLRYLSALRFCAVVLGNSSSGMIEAPSLGIPTINVGDRQAGRICAKSVLSCENDVQDIDRTLRKALSAEFRNSIINVNNPYEKKQTSRMILDIIRKALDRGIDIKKRFYDIDFDMGD